MPAQSVKGRQRVVRKFRQIPQHLVSPRQIPAIQQDEKRYAERLGNLVQVGDADVHLAPLHLAQVTFREAGGARQFPLRQVCRQPKTAHTPAEP